MSGSIVIGLVLVLGIVALILVGSSSTENKKERLRTTADAGEKSAGGSAGRGLHQAVKRSTADSEEILRESSLIVPPPDEKRIEAVPPKNDGFRMKGRV